MKTLATVKPSLQKNQHLVFLTLSLFLAGCASVSKQSGFLDHYDQMHAGKYFKQEYVAPEARLSQYRKVKIEEIHLDYFIRPNSYSDEDLDHLRKAFRKSLERELSKKYLVLGEGDSADAETLIITPALLSVASPKRLLNAATTVFLGPSFSSGHAMFQMKLKDGANGLAVAEVGEKRKGGNLRVKSLAAGAYFKHIHSEAAFDTWAKNLANFIRENENPK